VETKKKGEYKSIKPKHINPIQNIYPLSKNNGTDYCRECLWRKYTKALFLEEIELINDSPSPGYLLLSK